jgi:hypothetical protein
MMSQILNKLLYISISDPDEEVREIMLGSLNKNFNPYLKDKSSLQTLILALNDCNDRVQTRAVMILRRLISLNSSEIVPALQNSLYRILRVINTKSTDNEKDIIQNLKLLTCYITVAPFLLKDQRDIILKFLLNMLQNQSTTQTVSAQIFSTLSSLVTIAKSSTIRYFDQLMQVTLESLKDMAFTKKRIEAIRCLSNIIRTSGLVVFVSYRYPSLTDLTFLLFQVEANEELRGEIMRLMGVLGALDTFNLFRTIPDVFNSFNHLSDEELVKMAKNNHKSRFYFSGTSFLTVDIILSKQISEDRCEIRLKNFFKNIINLNQIFDKSVGDEILTQVIELNQLGTKKKDQMDMSIVLMNETGVTDEKIRALLLSREAINLSDVESLLNHITSVGNCFNDVGYFEDFVDQPF